MAAAFRAEMIRKIAEGKYTPDELSAFLKELDELDEASYIRVFNELYILAVGQIPGAIDPHFKATLEARLDRVPVEADTDERNDRPVVTMRPGIRWIRWVAAAAVILLLGGGAYLINRQINEKPTIAAFPKPDVQSPSSVRATITLGNGQKILLDSAGNGTLARQGNTQVVKLANGQVAYKIENISNHEMLFNTLSNPRGSQVVTLTLSDGTKVWLNAESSIRYPVIFTGQDRAVEISGEAYFEVSKKPDQPFIVDIKNGAKIEVLGTDFNVSAYADEDSIKATLMEGSVRVAVATSSNVGGNTNIYKLSVVLKPGQQAGLKTNNGIGNASRGVGKMSVLNNVDIAAVMAWKNGLFEFSDADIHSVMRQMGRWYGVEVRYVGKKQTTLFTGQFKRSCPASEAFRILSLTGYQFKIVKDTIFVQ